MLFIIAPPESLRKLESGWRENAKIKERKPILQISGIYRVGVHFLISSMPPTPHFCRPDGAVITEPWEQGTMLGWEMVSSRALAQEEVFPQVLMPSTHR